MLEPYRQLTSTCSQVETDCINSIRFLAVDAVNKAPASGKRLQQQEVGRATSGPERSITFMRVYVCIYIYVYMPYLYVQIYIYI